MKTSNSVFYQQRADETAKLAAETKLANVRDSLLTSERAWRVMAKSAVEFEDAAASRLPKTTSEG